MRNILIYSSHFRHFYSRAFQELAAEYSLTQLEVDILLFLYNNPNYNTARDITSIRGFAKSNVSTAIEALRKKGFLSSEADPENRRVQRLFLLDSSMEKITALAKRQEQCFQQLLSGFSAKELTLLKEFFCRIDKNIMNTLEEK